MLPEAPARIKSLLPAVKLIVLLRDPVERVLSQFIWWASHGMEYPANSHHFAERLARDSILLEQCPAKVFVNGQIAFDWARIAECYQLGESREEVVRNRIVHWSYLARGLYADQLMHWFSFFPRNQFLILKSEVFFSQPGELMATISEFLGLEQIDWTPVVSTAFNKADSTVKVHMSHPERLFLQRWYSPHNRRLQNLLGEEFYWGYWGELN